MIQVSYILISYNGLHFLQQLLPSMHNQMQREDVEVILVDNGSCDGTKEYVQTQYPKIHLLSLPYNKGVAYARNRALEQAKGEKLFILDNDTIVNDTAVEGLEHYLTTHPKVGLVSCQLEGLHGEKQTTFLPFPGIKVKLAHLLNISLPIHKPIYVIGACQVIRRQTFEQVGLLDESIFYGPEDCDYCMRIQAAGWEIAYLPQLTITHLCQRTTHHHFFSLLTWKHIQGLLRFYHKYHRWW